MSLTFPHSAPLHRHHLFNLTLADGNPGKAPTATPHGGLLFGPLAEYNALTSYEPNSWVEVSSGHTPKHYPSNEHGFHTKSDHTATVAASENFDGFQKPAVASSSQHCVELASGNRCDDPRSVATPCLNADVWKHRETVACNEPISSVERMLSRGKRDRDLDSVKIQSDRHSLYVYLEQKADLAVQGEYSAQRRLSEAEADMDMREWEKRGSDLALHETNRELESHD